MGVAKISRRKFLVTAGAVAGVSALRPLSFYGGSPSLLVQSETPADYTLTIATKPIELAPKHIVSVTTYNGQFPGPLLRFKEGQRVTVDVPQRDRHPRAASLAWSGYCVGCRWCGRRRNAIHPSSWKPENFVRSKAVWLSLLSHACPGWQRSQQGAVQWTRRSGIYRAEKQSWTLRS
jgi:hypothetical protein